LKVAHVSFLISPLRIPVQYAHSTKSRRPSSGTCPRTAWKSPFSKKRSRAFSNASRGKLGIVATFLACLPEGVCLVGGAEETGDRGRRVPFSLPLLDALLERFGHPFQELDRAAQLVLPPKA
jgi:hypothetical protein